MSKNHHQKIPSITVKPIRRSDRHTMLIGINFSSRHFLFLFIFIIRSVYLNAQDKTLKLPFITSESKGFEENNGQLINQYNQKNKEVKYLFHSKGLNVQLKKNS